MSISDLGTTRGESDPLDAFDHLESEDCAVHCACFERVADRGAQVGIVFIG